MITLEQDRLVFRFPDVHADAVCAIDFQRTLRIPDNGKTYPLPPGFGRFPLRHLVYAGGPLGRQVLPREVGDEVAEPVDVDHRALQHRRRHLLRRRGLEPHVVTDLVAHLPRVDPLGVPRGDGREDVPAVERVADRLAEVGLGRGPHPVGALAEVDDREVLEEDVLLVDLAVELAREDRLADLPGDRSIAAGDGVLHPGEVAGQELAEIVRGKLGRPRLAQRRDGARGRDAACVAGRRVPDRRGPRPFLHRRRHDVQSPR